MALTLMGEKKGMTQLFDENGNVIPVTVIHCEPNVVTQIKTLEIDGYNAIQLGYEKAKTKDPRTKERRIGKPLMGHFKKASVEPRKHMCESRLDNVEDFTICQEVTVDLFSGVKYVDVTGVSKGKGCQGVIKVHGFSGGPASHGSGFHRSGGSTGMRSTPGWVFPGTKKAKRLGNESVTMQNLEVARIDVENNLLLIKGSIPGPTGRKVYIQRAVKK